MSFYILYTQTWNYCVESSCGALWWYNGGRAPNWSTICNNTIKIDFVFFFGGGGGGGWRFFWIVDLYLLFGALLFFLLEFLFLFFFFGFCGGVVGSGCVPKIICINVQKSALHAFHLFMIAFVLQSGCCNCEATRLQQAEYVKRLKQVSQPLTSLLVITHFNAFLRTKWMCQHYCAIVERERSETIS